ncbi:MAG: pantetheine-phosphate adenylyltransferase [Ilumatobacteraceae bacterium]|jgi:pantetheine-phosphate adenylyltransferase
MAKVLYPGSFDPIHIGHVDVIEQAIELFGHVVVATMHNPSKPGGLFSLEERLEMIEESLEPLRSDGIVDVLAFPGLAIDAARETNVDFMVKGLRTAGDFEVELQMAHTNFVASGVRTVYVPCNPALGYVSSRFVREIAHYGGDVSAMVPPPVLAHLQRASRS